jgi:hypothetical protein
LLFENYSVIFNKLNYCERRAVVRVCHSEHIEDAARNEADQK